MATEPTPQQKPTIRGIKMSWGPVAIGLTFILVVVISLPTVLVTFFGLLPTLVAFIIDRTSQRYATFCVGGINLCGVFPYLLELWSGPGDINAATDIFTDVFALLLMYSAAGIGWMLFITVPPVVSAFLQVMAERRMSQCRDSQSELVEEWGEEIVQVVAEALGEIEDEAPLAAE